MAGTELSYFRAKREDKKPIESRRRRKMTQPRRRWIRNSVVLQGGWADKGKKTELKKPIEGEGRRPRRNRRNRGGRYTTREKGAFFWRQWGLKRLRAILEISPKNKKNWKGGSCARGKPISHKGGNRKQLPCLAREMKDYRER